MNNNGVYVPNASDILYGSFIKYDRLFEMTKFAFYGKTDSTEVNVYIDVYSILRSLYTRSSKMMIIDSYSIASCLINLAIHLRAYFETRHGTYARIFIVYGGSRIKGYTDNIPQIYNFKNIQMEESDTYLRDLIKDNLEVVKILCPYLQDIFAVVDYTNEFNPIVSSLIDMGVKQGIICPNIIYSKDPLSYQLVAYKPKTFLYRPKRRANQDASWVVTKSGLYDNYRYGELELSKQFPTTLDFRMFNVYQAISGVKSRSIPSIKNGNQTVKFLESAVEQNVFANGYNYVNIVNPIPSVIDFFNNNKVDYMRVIANYHAIDLQYQTSLYQCTPDYLGLTSSLINLYNPQEVRNINDKYFQKYPLDLNRV